MVFLIIDPTEGTETWIKYNEAALKAKVFLIIDPTEGTETVVLVVNHDRITKFS